LGNRKKSTGRRKIDIQYIDDKNRRQITFSKRKAGLIKKAYELTTLTNAQILLIVCSETGHNYSFATPKLQPVVSQPDAKIILGQLLSERTNPITEEEKLRMCSNGYLEHGLWISSKQHHQNTNNNNNNNNNNNTTTTTTQSSQSVSTTMTATSSQNKGPVTKKLKK